MIQRIQSIYLLLAAVLLIVTICLPLGYFTDADGVVHVFKSMGMEFNGSFQATTGILSILVLNAIVALSTIFLYKNRVLQIRMSIFNSLLIVGFYIAFIGFYFAFKSEANTFSMGWALALPLIAIILNILALRAIKKDDGMVKAADRLR